jgi:hypothetical protein
MVAGAVVPGVAHATVISGSQTNWDSGAFDVNSQRTNPAPKNLTVSYDDVAGRLVTTLTLDRALSWNEYASVNFAIAKPNSGQGCGRQNGVTTLGTFNGWINQGYGSSGSFYLDASSGYTGELYTGGSQTGAQTYTFTFSGQQAFTRQPFKCVVSPNVNANQSYESDNFCLGSCPAQSQPPVVQPGGAPPAPTGTRGVVNGQTVTLNWDASTFPRFSYFAIRRGTQPDTNAGSWTRLNGNYTSPTVTDNPGPGTFYYYVTQIDTAGNVSARSATVRVVVPAPAASGAGGNPTPVATPTPTPAPAGGSTTNTGNGGGASPITTPVIVSHGDTPVVAAPPSASGQRSISAKQAAKQAKSALRIVFGSRYTKARRFTITCKRNSATKRTCSVAWTAKGRRYKGHVVVRLGASSYSTTVDVRRLKAA